MARQDSTAQPDTTQSRDSTQQLPGSTGHRDNTVLGDSRQPKGRSGFRANSPPRGAAAGSGLSSVWWAASCCLPSLAW
jgi:hypothetical protein